MPSGTVGVNHSHGLPKLDDAWIKSRRGKKNPVDISRPYAWLSEKECTADGQIENVSVLFLTNRECPWKCLMCDLWKNTIGEKLPAGAIPGQIRYALDHLPPSKSIKLYNSGSFFDPAAIPPEDYPDIARILEPFETVIVENHPKLTLPGTAAADRCIEFAGMLEGKLELAMGLETVHSEILRLLNKKMSTEDFRMASDFLNREGIASRTFILLRPPFLREEESIRWAKKSIDFAFDSGSGCCIVIPVRGGNGALEFLVERGDFHPPALSSLETVLEYGIGLNAGRVFADMWDIEQLPSCPECQNSRIRRIQHMNLQQFPPESILCGCI